MGESKRKKSLTTNGIDIPKEVLTKTSYAIRSVFTAAASHFGTDCYLHAVMAKALLNRAGYDVMIINGFAGWRVGEADGDVILHAKMPNIPPQAANLAFHSWLEFNGSDGHRVILDFTTYQLKEKAAQLDLLDGGHTNVDWCPDYLLAPKRETSSMVSMRQGHAGQFYYQQDAVIEGKLSRSDKAMDPDDFAAMCVAYDNPGINVVGPRNMKR